MIQRTLSAAVIVVALCGQVLRAEVNSAIDPQSAAFLTKHCSACHSGDEEEREFRVDELSADFDETANANRWELVLRKLKAREMPPPDEPQPKQNEVARLVTTIESQLIAANQRTQRREGRTRLRRLNRTEYQNTINDLFAVNVDVRDLLPEDNSAHGFDNNGAALNISSVLLERYLEAADVALDAAIVTEVRPKTTKRRFSYLDERRVKDHASYLRVDDALVFFSSGYSPTEINQFRAPQFGDYRVRVSAHAYQSDQPVTFRVYSSIGDKHHLAGYFEAQPKKPTMAEFTTRIGFRKTIRVVPFGTYLTKWADAKHEEGSGLAVQWVEIEGPLIDQWPPASHQRIFSDLPIEVTNAAEMKKNRRLKPLREVVSSDHRGDAIAIFKRLLPRMFRRSVDDTMIAPYLGIFETKLNEGYSFQNAIRVALKAALCSPEFLYVLEGRRTELGDFEVASRLSYFLWSTMPDDELLKAAGNGELRKAENLRRQTERMLSDSKASALTKNFVGQWLRLREIDDTTPDKMLYPEFDEWLQISMVNETEAFFDELLKHDLSVLNVVDSDFAMLNERLARHYGVDGVRGLEVRRVALPSGSHRGGILTQASVLKVTANGTNTSPVLRGVWLLDNILGQPVPPPPANVPAVEPDIRGATSIRDQIARHREDASCASCHKRIDPAGFALENFDVIGGWRVNYRSIGEGERVEKRINGRGVRYKIGQPVESSGVLSDGSRFDDIESFKRLLLRDETQIVRCLTEKLLTYATGNGIEIADRKETERIVLRAKENNYGLRSLIHEVVQSRIFLSK